MFPRNWRVRRSNNGRQMQLAKNVIDVGRVAVPERVSRSDARLPMRPIQHTAESSDASKP